MRIGMVSHPGSTEEKTEMSSRLWILQLSAPERSALIATFAGWMLDGMDVMAYSLVLPTLLLTWNISKGQAGLLSTSTLVISSFGGWLAGILADRFGRVRILKLTIFWFAFFTFLSGFTQNFGELLATRGLQGLGFGGEWAVGATLMGETIRARFRGRAVGAVQGGWAIGWGISAVAFTVLFSFLPHATAWRVMFWIGILPAFLIFYIQSKVEEPEIYETSANAERGRLLDIFAPELLRTTAFTSIMALGAQGGYYAVTTWLPLYLTTTRGLTTLNAGTHLFVIIGGAFLGYMAAAHLTDAIGRKRTLALFAACSFLTVLFYSTAPISNRAVMVLGFPLGFFPSGCFGPMGAFFSELFPTPIRASGTGFAYNFGRGVGALFPTLVGLFSAHTSLGTAIAIFGSGAYLIMIVGALALPETRGRELKGD
jgi:MFS family permease